MSNRSVPFISLFFIGAAGGLFPSSLCAAPAYVQGNFAIPQTAQAAVTVGYPAAQTAGDLNVVVVGWSDQTQVVSSVVDTIGNTYQLAVGPRRQSPLLNPPFSFPATQSIYYAKNIAGGSSNNVTVNFSGAVASPDIRILQYRGIDPFNPIDVAVGAAGNTGNQTTGISSSGTIQTTNVSDLLVGANYVESWTTGPGSGFTQRILTSPDGDIVEDRVVAATGFYSAGAPVEGPNAGWVMQMVAFRSATNLPPDTTPPTLSITAPAAGSTVSGTITVTVSASDSGTGVAAVRFGLDGVPYGTALTASPYTFTLNTAKFAGGPHTLTASAWDFANNLGSAKPISLTFVSSGNPALNGMSSGTVPLPIVPINSVLLPNGKILMWDGQSMGTNAIVWNYMTNRIDRVPAPANIFCSGTEQMADGRILVVGGHDGNAHLGLPVANIFNPSTELWTVLPEMSFARWYPTATMLANGSLIVTSGETNCDECDAPVQEIYHPSTNSWSQLNSAPFVFAYYPHVFQLPDGRVLVSATTEAPIISQVLDLNALAWTSVGGTTALDGGSSAMHLPAKFLKTGKSFDPDDTPVSSVATAYVLDMTQASPVWRQVTSMHFPRTYHNTTILPNGNVLVTGGGTTTDAIDTADAVLTTEVWSPVSEVWTPHAALSAPRLYHSEALLLPDGRVMICGGGRFNDDTEATDQFSAEFFSPPYLFQGTRPTITTAPSQLFYGQNFNVVTPNASGIAKVSLIRFGSVTHNINMSQRFIPLSFSVRNGSLTVKAPMNANLAPPGNYMLFLVGSNGVPSLAANVHF